MGTPFWVFPFRTPNGSLWLLDVGSPELNGRVQHVPLVSRFDSIRLGSGCGGMRTGTPVVLMPARIPFLSASTDCAQIFHKQDGMRWAEGVEDKF